jgi:hypothetical protein
VRESVSFLFLMLRLINESFYYHSLPCYLYKRQGDRLSAHIRSCPLVTIFRHSRIIIRVLSSC